MANVENYLPPNTIHVVLMNKHSMNVYTVFSKKSSTQFCTVPIKLAALIVFRPFKRHIHDELVR